ncbi:hypothetical protein HMPREF9151_01368 [Hoylesella saccharolytica F0055]|uniref:Uncharacterized protein n=1 Tax=Hoylesella saccharolytica F0055 TaxID=1127699 RepID=L1N9S8_9BACT|nr:hypothetical protein HMPREF9151_01368 [Hoylesella saccharolytica F0055]
MTFNFITVFYQVKTYSLIKIINENEMLYKMKMFMAKNIFYQ